jgi:hypothetical protein
MKREKTWSDVDFYIYSMGSVERMVLLGALKDRCKHNPSKQMTDYSKFVRDGSDIVLAPCKKCVFTYRRCTRERDAYRAESNRPACAWHMTGVPVDILKCKKECSHYVEKTER